MSDAASIIPRLSELLTTFTGEAKTAALAKCAELGFDLNRADIPIEESFINLQSATHVLRDAIKRQKLNQIPLSLQKRLLEAVEAVSNSLAGFTAGRDEVETFTNAVERANAEIWQSRLMDLSPEVLGFQTKLNQLKQQEVETAQLTTQLREGLAAKAELEDLAQRAKESETTAAEHGAKTVTLRAEVEQKLIEVKTIADSANAILATITQNDVSVSERLASATTSSSAVTAIEERIKTFHGEVDAYRRRIDDIQKTADDSATANNEKANALMSKLSELQDSIKVQIEHATGFTLFHSFQKRQEQIKKAKIFWGVVLGILIVVSIALSCWIMESKETFTVAFYLKLSISIPLIYAISFGTIQYSRERKLEEEYAFKSNISISLDPYQDLVSRVMKLHVATDPEQAKLELAKFTTFILDSITKVFTSPTERVFESPQKEQPISDKAFEKALKLAAAVAEIAKGAKPGP